MWHSFCFSLHLEIQETIHLKLYDYEKCIGYGILLVLQSAWRCLTHQAHTEKSACGKLCQESKYDKPK